MTIEQLTNNPEYKLHHTASRKGYESRRGSGHIEEYDGRYGTGYIHIQPRYDTTRFVRVTYYIRVA